MVQKVSIVIPVYNVEKYISTCLESVINQTYSDLEIIVVNDGSTDNSGKILKKYVDLDKRIVLINKKNGGLSSARNTGILASNGQFITFIDSDDWVSKNYVEEMILEQQKYDADIVSIRETTVITNEKKIHSLKGGVKVFKNDCVDALFSFWDTNFAWGKLIKTNIIKNKINFPQGRNYEDIGTIYKIYNEANTLVISDKATYFYRIRANSITANIKKSDILDLIYFLKKIKKFNFKKQPKYLDCYILCKGFTALSILYKSNLDSSTKKYFSALICKSTGKYKPKWTWLFLKENFVKILLMDLGLATKALSIKNRILKVTKK